MNKLSKGSKEAKEFIKKNKKLLFERFISSKIYQQIKNMELLQNFYEPLVKNKSLNVLVLVATSYLLFVIFYAIFSQNYFELYNLVNVIFLGIFISYIFYVLVIYIPTEKKKNAMKKSLSFHYKDFKKEAISIFLDAAHISYVEDDKITELCDLSKFKEFFNEVNKSNGAEGTTKWDGVLNGLDANEYLQNKLLMEMEILRNEVLFILNNTEIDDQEIFMFLKRFSQSIYRLRHLKSDFDDMKTKPNFLWDLFTGWSPMGYLDKDIIKEMIKKI